MGLKEYLLSVVEGDRNRFRDQIVKYILSLLAKIYRGAVFLRRKAYDWKLKRQTTLQAGVISVGNITVGGTGKTPVVKKLARELTAAGYQVAVLSRGYKGSFSGEVGIVSNGKEVLMTPEEAGDEAYMLADSLPQVPVLVGSKRSKTGSYACRFFEPEFIILDDGFQHWQVKRDYDLVVVDATDPFSNRRVLPRGRLREPLSSLQRSHLFLLTKADQVSKKRLTALKNELVRLNPGTEVITTSHAPAYMRKVGDQNRRKIDLEGESVLAMSGIGAPQSFEQTLEDLGAEVAEKIRFQDHHVYTEQEMMEVFTLASEKNVDQIVTTEKDAVSMNEELITKINRQQIELEVLGIEIEMLASEREFTEIISKLEVLAECR